MRKRKTMGILNYLPPPQKNDWIFAVLGLLISGWIVVSMALRIFT